jgi:Arc/MetJ-type ribon-helix-helix transcriptional regulator
LNEKEARMDNRQKSKRIGVRLEEPERAKLEQLVKQGEFSSISEAARLALQKFLTEIPQVE